MKIIIKRNNFMEMKRMMLTLMEEKRKSINANYTIKESFLLFFFSFFF